VSVAASLPTTLNIGTAAFTVCPAAKVATCTIGNLPVGQADELEVTVKVSAQAVPGEQLELTTIASAAGSLGYSSTATDAVVSTVTINPSASPTAPLVTLPVPATVPTISGTSVSPTDPSGLFPTVGASPGTGTGLNLPPADSRSALHAATAAAAVPLDTRLLGGQIAGLAVLAGAIAIAIARLSLRRQKAGEPNSPKPPE
jgi:hypothetical protein